MIAGKARTATLIALTVYTAIMLYILYFGFDRMNNIHDGTQGYNLVPNGIPLSLPIGGWSWLWFYNFANFAAFLPYGMFVPLVARVGLLRLAGLFLVTISILETLQWGTGLGSFDIDDILTNMLGVVVGYMAQRWVPRPKGTWKGFAKILAAAALLSFGTIVAVQGMNHLIEKATSVEAGREVGIDSLPVKARSVVWDPSLAVFEVGGHRVKPQVNLFSRENPGSMTVTYALDGKYVTFSGYMAVPDDISEGVSTIVITLDGGEGGTATTTLSRTESSEPQYFEMDARGARELTLTVRNEDENPNTNVLLWDLTLTEIQSRR
ncbi:VanZ family protein [Cohnella hongkongensis]|uniref:VanZ family protein n=1 Tax=Cohnella hongkongensis TaxID=178337 RepID=A0ABV9FAA0_9BACL